MERKHSEQAPMSIGWYINEIKRLEAEVARWKGRMKAILGEDEPDVVGNRILSLQEEVVRLTALVQEHQTYQTKQGIK